MPHPDPIAIPVADLDAARAFYAGVLGATERAAIPATAELDLCGHRLSLILAAPAGRPVTLVLPTDDWTALAGRLEEAATDFIAAPQRRRGGTPDEHWFMALRDPAGNRIEITARPSP